MKINIDVEGNSINDSQNATCVYRHNIEGSAGSWDQNECSLTYSVGNNESHTDNSQQGIVVVKKT
jgi:hypothetical protein